MALFTFIMEYEGGTYISQVYAESVEKAKVEWVERLEVSEIHDFDKSDKNYLITEMNDKYPTVSETKIETVRNVWCISFLTENDKSGLVNIIQTVEKTDNAPLTNNN